MPGRCRHHHTPACLELVASLASTFSLVASLSSPTHGTWTVTFGWVTPVGSLQPPSPPRVKQIQDKIPATLPLLPASPSPAFSLQGYNSKPFFHTGKNIDSESFAKLGGSLLCCFSSLLSRVKQPCKSWAGSWKHSVLDLPQNCSLLFFFLLLKLFSPPKLIKSAFVFLNHSIDSSNSVQLNKAAANKPEWHLGPCTACHPFHQCFPFLFGGYYLSVLFVWQFFLGFANIYIVWFL